MKHISVSISLFFISIISIFAQQLKSPDEFLGYQLGDKYTPHHKIVSYFEQAAAAKPQVMKLEQYGKTSEGRPLLLAVIASETNFTRLEEIRKNNLRLTGMLNDKPADLNAPAIVWLSYNVHGNETSSSEVSMKTLYELLNPGNAQTKEYLKNVVVIIDPCINPDGRDRYVNWFVQMEGENANPDPNAREHTEPWPGGRYNHYNFDLNRDWAWQTQVETKQRMIQYNRWMPQVHSDYHEQGYNSPYYFAPAAEPYHEVITPWQRDFQVAIGKNNAKYFDANGWLYFTKEIFDLFYPSYGDTYPTYNGSVGMTFEQGGGGRAGAAVVIGNGDTLTLNDRIAHHFTTSMSTLEVVAKNVARVVKEFKQFFDDSKNNGVGEYKSFVVTDVNTNKINALKHLLNANGILYGTTAAGNLKGYNYFTGKEEFFAAANSLVVSTYQPKGVLAKVLFEPRSKLIDSATYDITAWSLPYVYGLQAYAVKEKIAMNNYVEKQKNNVIRETSYGYLVSYVSFEDAKFLAAILKAGIRVRYAEKDFSSNGSSFKRGTMIVLKKGNEGKMEAFTLAAQKYDANVTAISSGFMETGADFGSEKVHFISKPKVAMLTGKGVDPSAAGEVWYLFDQQLNYPLTLINAEDLGNINWKRIDVLILPNGRYQFLSDKDGDKELKTWIRQGGKLIAMENAVAQMAAGDWNIKSKKNEEEKKDKDKEDKPLTYAEIKKFEESEHNGIMSNIAGAIYKIELDNSHPLALGFPNFFYNLKQDANMYEFLKDGWNVGIIKKDSYTAGFVGNTLKDKIKEGVSMGVQDYGRGSVVYLADNPIFRCFWENGKMLFSNAVFLVGQ
ncbi:MAG: zinc carboxypeptidase [Ferruginibacter sp.]|nr:zinc carboxypeptidase [Ferruginibacter sp.]